MWGSVTTNLYAAYCSTNLMTRFSILETNISATPPTNSYPISTLSSSQQFWNSLGRLCRTDFDGCEQSPFSEAMR